MARIYLSPPHLTGEEYSLVEDALASNWVAPLGPSVDAFEQEFAESVQVPNVLAVSSGTAALHLALRIIGLEPGDEVLCPTLTFVATANAILYERAVPVFIDCDPSSWTVDVNLLEEELKAAARVGKLPRVVMTVDLYGQSADHDENLSLCAGYEIPVIEDAAEGLGATYKGRPLGAFGRFGAFSFNGNKIITTSGGGALVSDDEDAIAQARHLATQAKDATPYYEHSAVGYNYRMSNILAAIGRAQLASLKDRVSARQRIFDRYVELLGDIPGVDFMPAAPWGEPTRWLTCLTLDPALTGASNEELRLALEQEDIETRHLWKPMHMQPIFASNRHRGGNVSSDLFGRGLCLPSGSDMTDSDIERVAVAFRSRCPSAG